MELSFARHQVQATYLTFNILNSIERGLCFQIIPCAKGTKTTLDEALPTLTLRPSLTNAETLPH